MQEIAAINEKVKFIKQVPVHYRDRLRKKKQRTLSKLQFILEIN